MNIKIKSEIIKTETIQVPDKLAVFEDKKTGVKTVAFPFTFASGKTGILSVTHLDKFPWTPSKDIEEITIKFK